MKYGLHDYQLEKINNVLAKHQEIDKALLYGSRAKGSYLPASDIDLVLVGDNMTTTVLYDIAQQIDELLLPHTVDLSIYHQISNPDLLAHISRVGLLLYKRD
jgi:predicted nucleotidyltransferase